MFLEKLEIQGFKSFAKKTILEFPNKIKGSHSITAIVGPNGSGKSNIADSIRWVLGEQSIKTLRGKKSQDVIFSGSDKKARLGFAEVSLYLNNQNKSADIDYSELAITRRVYQSGEGEYFINKAKARLSDIQLLLAKANFGQRTYSIIGQGMADSVLSASLQERKELFDEAVGVKQFQLKRDQALNKFKAARQNLAQAELTLNEIEPRLRSLTRQVKKLEKRESIEKELKNLQKDYYAQIWQALEGKIQELNQKKNKTEKIYQTLNQELAEIQKQINFFSAETSIQETYNKIQEQYNNLLQQENSLIREQTILKAKKDLKLEKQGQTNLVWLNQRLDEISQNLQELKNKKNELEKSIDQEENILQNKQAQAESINKRLDNVKQELSKLQKTSQLPFEQEKELEHIFNQQQDLVDKLLKAQKPEDLEEIKNQARQISQKLALYLEKLKTLKSQDSQNLINLQTQLETLSQEKNDLKLEISQIIFNLNIKKEKIGYLGQEIAKTKSEQEKINKEIELSQFKPGKEKEFVLKINQELKAIDAKIEKLDEEIKKQAEKISQFNHEEQNKKENILNLQKQSQEKQNQINQYGLETNQYNIDLARLQTKLESIEAEIKQNQIDFKEIKAHRLEGQIDEEATYQKIEQLKRQLEIIGGIDEETQAEYKEIKDRHDFITKQSRDLEEAIKSLEKIIEELDKTIKEQFDKAFKEINKEFQKYFKILFNGGQAELMKVTTEEVKKEEATDQDNETKIPNEDEGILARADKFEKKIKEREKESYSGIEIKAVPPGKKIKAINMLSGGERALTSIALICAIIHNNPSPFIVLDEVDAALDEANSERFATILEELAKKTQFIIITHNRVTMHYAHVLYGVTMGDDGISKMLSVKLSDAEDMVGNARG